MNFLNNIYRRLADRIGGLRRRLRADRERRADLMLTHQVAGKRRLPAPRQWVHVGRVMTLCERRVLKVGILLLMAGAFVLVGRWAIVHGRTAPARGGEYREGIVGAPRAVNPVLAGSNDVDQDLIRLVFSGLYRRDAYARLTPDLAAAVDVSADGKTYTFTLREARFHDNTPVTADDVVFTIATIQNPSWKSPLARNFSALHASATDAHTVVITLDKPSSYLPSLLTVGILPKHIWENVSPGSAALTDFNLKPVGSGPFRFDKFVRDSHGAILSYTVRSFDRAPKKAMLDRITFKFFDDYDTAVDKLTSNAVDGLNFVPPGRRDVIAKIPGISVRTPALSQYTAVFLNPRVQPLFADAAVREAFARAIDRERIVRDSLHGNAELRDAPIPEGATGSTTSVTRYSYDPAAAEALLEKAGYVRAEGSTVRTKTVPGKTRRVEPTVTPLAVKLTVIDSDENRAAAEVIKADWEAIGAQVEIVPIPAADIQLSAIKPRSYEALIFGEILGPESDPFPFWHSSQATDGLNLSLYANRRVDELLEKARVTATDVERGTLLAEFQQIVTKEIPAIFLYQPTYAYPQTAKLRGFDARRLIAPADRFSNVVDWYLKTGVSFR